MTDNIDKKVINIFVKHSKKTLSGSGEEKVYSSPDGFNYVHINSDGNGQPLQAEKILEKADEQWYIIKILEHHTNGISMKNYKVPGDRLLEFLAKFMSEDRPGKIIEIDKYYPDELA